MTETQILRQAVVSAWRRANDFYGLSLAVPEVDFSLKGRSAGQACWRRVKIKKLWRTIWSEHMSIRLNLDAYRLDSQDMVNDTIPHEVSHLIAQTLTPEKRLRPHGKEWQQVMRECFGIHQAHRTHHLVLPKARQVKRCFLYRCQCDKEHLLTSIRHNRSRRGTVYRCRTCGQALRFLRVEHGDANPI